MKLCIRAETIKKKPHRRLFKFIESEISSQWNMRKANLIYFISKYKEVQTVIIQILQRDIKEKLIRELYRMRFNLRPLFT